MEEILSYLLKSAGVLSIFALTYHFLLRRLTFFKANRWFLLFGMLASIAFPLIEITQTVYVERPETVVSPQEILSPMAYVLQEPIVEPLIDISQVLLLLYASISLFFLGKMVVELLSLRRLINSGKRRREDGFVRISLSRKVTPFSFFNFICFYENEENTAATQLILKHEQVHAREWHSVDLLLTHIYCAVFWMNPLAWLLKRQIGENLEFIADATAKVENTSGISYERTLLSSAASHMQPALANNFFTPFIKKRIQMLQKETSKKWNAYKYALILPVIVLFLYSFNTVTKTEYIKGKSEKIATVGDPLIFDITSTTSQAELDRFVEMINDYASFKMDLKMETEKGNKKVINVYTDFEKKELINNFRMELASGKLLLLEVSKDQVKLQNTLTNDTMIINDQGTAIGNSDPMLYESAISVYGPNAKNSSASLTDSKQIRFSIPPTTTKQSLERIKKTLKIEYNVDFSYRNLTYKDGKIIKIKIDLNDNRGFKGSQTYNNNVAIPTICIVGILEENKKSWGMGNCDDNRMSSNSSNEDVNKILGSIQNLNLSKMKFKMSKRNMDSLQLTLKNLQSDLSEFPKDEISKQLKARLLEAENRLSNMNLDSMMFGDPKVTVSLGSTTFTSNDSVTANSKDIWAYQGKDSVKRLYGENPPLVIKDGVEFSQIDLEKIDSNTIESISVLKDKAATSLYGDKGKNGVIIVTTKVGSETTNSIKPMQFSGSAISKNSKNGFLTVYTPNTIDGLQEFATSVDPYLFVNSKKIANAQFKKLDPFTIKLVKIFNGKEATDKYGENAKDGALEIVLKSVSEMKMTEDELQNIMFPKKQTSTRSNSTSTSTTRSYSTSSSSTIITIDKFTDSEITNLKTKLEKEGVYFNLRTLTRKGNLVKKMKFDLDEVAYTFDYATGLKSLTIVLEKGKTPIAYFNKI